MDITNIKDEYDFSSSKFQNFGFTYTVQDEKNNQSKVVEVITTSNMVGKERLQSAIGGKFKILSHGF